jgi:hypothetical protein
MVRILMLVVALSIIGGAVAWSRAARAQSDVQWLYQRVCANYSSNDARAFCMTYINGVADLMQKNCEIARQRLSAGGLSNADDRRAMLSVSSNARAVYIAAGGMHAFIDWAKFLALVRRHLAGAAEPNAALLGSLAALAGPGADQLALPDASAQGGPRIAQASRYHRETCPDRDDAARVGARL